MFASAFWGRRGDPTNTESSFMSDMIALAAPSVGVTAAAARRIGQILAGEHGATALRISVEGGGCSGMNYVLGFDQKKDGDQEFLIDGIKVFMHKAHGLYLAGMQINFQDGLNARGFTFNNPNAASTCGCGTSFSV